MSKDAQIEQEIRAKGLNAPRITPADIQANIVSEHYFTAAQGDAKAMEDGAFENGSLNGAALRPVPAALGILTFCVLTLQNGFTVTGESACASPENFDAEIGRKIARENAVQKIWPLMGYELKQRLHKQRLNLSNAVDKLLETRIPILEQITDLCHAIEKCGASPELTDAVTKAGALREPISELVRQAIDLGIGTGLVGVSSSN